MKPCSYASVVRHQCVILLNLSISNLPQSTQEDSPPGFTPQPLLSLFLLCGLCQEALHQEYKGTCTWGKLPPYHPTSLLIYPTVCSFSSSTTPEDTGSLTNRARSKASVASVFLCGLCLAALPQGTQSPRSQGDSTLMVSLKASSYLVGSV